MRILTVLFLAWTLADPPRARAQESTNIVSLNLRDLRDKDPGVRARAAMILNNIAGPGSRENVRQQTRKAIPALLEALKDTDSTVRSSAASALGNVPGDMQAAVPALIEALHDKDSLVRAGAASALGWIGRNPELVVPALVTALREEDSQVHDNALNSLIKFGPAASTAVPALIVMLAEDDRFRRWGAARVLGAIGPGAQEAVPGLTDALKNKDSSISLEAAAALAKIGHNTPEAIAIAVRLLDAEDYNVRERAAAVLGEFGPAAEPSIPALTKALDDEDGDVRSIAAASLSKIAAALLAARRTQAIEAQQRAATAMEQSPDRRVKALAPAVTGALTGLRDIRRHDVKWQLLRPIRAHPRAAWATGGYLALALVCVSLFWLSPISLLKINGALDRIPKMKLPDWLGAMEVSVSHLLLAGFFRHLDRVLDAWVAKHVERARISFESNETIKKCMDPVPEPILLDREILPALTVNAVRSAFARPKTRLLIWGSDGDRNMNLACEIARWSMEPDPKKRLRQNLMLAVLLERDFVYTADKDADPFTKTVRDKLLLNETAPPLELVVHLLKRQRVLVIVRGLSELSQQTKSSIQPGNADFPANALVVTSQIEETFGGIGKTVIQSREENRRL